MKNQNQILDQVQSVMHHIINNGESENNDLQCSIEFNKLVKMMPPATTSNVIDLIKGEIVREVILNSEAYLQYIDTTLTPEKPYIQELVHHFTDTFLTAISKNYR